MKICILTGKFGLGHYTAAVALKQHIDASRLVADVEIIDWLSYISPKISEKYYLFFSLLVTKGDKFYNKRYLSLEDKKTDQKPELNLYFQRYFIKFMADKNPDLIISTLPICSQIVSRFKEKTGSRIPLITCITDITGHSEWISKNIDLYFVGSLTVKNKLISKAVPASRVHVTGIPVRLEFYSKSKLKNDVSCNTRKKILVMGGGLGLISADTEFYNGLSLLSETDVTIITGNNHKLYNSLYGRYKHVKILGYVSNVYDYMRWADVLITKPGGITTFEAIYCELPILALNPYLQQEIYNAEFIRDMNIGTIISGSSYECLDNITKILNYGCLEQYRNNIKKLKYNLSINNINDILEEVIMPITHSTNSCENKNLSNTMNGGVKDEEISFNF